MASTFTLTSASYDGRYLQVSCTQTKENGTGRSKIDWTLSSIGGGSNYYSTGPTSLYINGERVYYSARKEWNSETFPAAKGSTSGTIYVSHDTNGNKTIAVSLSTAIYTSTVTTKEGNWQLDNVPRGATIVSGPDFNDTQLPTVTYSNPAGTTVESLDICLVKADGVNAWTAYRSINKTGTLSYTFTSADVAVLKNNTVNSLKFKYCIRTKISGVYYYSLLEKTFTMTDNTDTKPSVSLSVAADNGSYSSQFGGLYIQGKSKLAVNISATGKYNASISSYSAEADGKTYNQASFTSEAVKTAGTVKVVGYATDSRGFTGSANKQITVVPYSIPQIESFSAERQADGTTVVAHLKGGISPVENKNSKTFSVTLNGVTKEISSTSYDVDDSVTFTDVPTDTTLTAVAKISDAFTTSPVTKNATVPTVEVTMDFHSSGKGVAFGKVAEYENLLDIAWNTSIKGTLTASHIDRIDGYDGKNFNDLVYNTGYYTSGATPSAAGCKNYPVDTTGVLEVISQIFTNATTGNKWGFAYQTYRTYTGDIYTRSYYSDTGFTTWKKIQFV